MKEFNPQIFTDLNYYVYGLQDPETKKIFYIGYGQGNRVFQHEKENKNGIKETEKIDHIKKIGDEKVEHIIIRHSLTKQEALIVEAALIDLLRHQNQKLTNVNAGYASDHFGLKTSEEIHRQYNPPKLTELKHPVVIININKEYPKGGSIEDIYKAVKGDWVIASHRIKTVKYVLAEYLGQIVGVFKVKKWYTGENTTRYRFTKDDNIEEKVKDYYLTKSIRDYKKQGASNPVRFNLNQK